MLSAPCVASCTVCAASTHWHAGSSSVARTPPWSHPAQHASVAPSAAAVRAQCAGVAFIDARVGKRRRRKACSSSRSAESIGGRFGLSSSVRVASSEKTYAPCSAGSAPCSAPSAASRDGDRLARLGCRSPLAAHAASSIRASVASDAAARCSPKRCVAR